MRFPALLLLCLYMLLSPATLQAFFISEDEFESVTIEWAAIQNEVHLKFAAKENYEVSNLFNTLADEYLEQYEKTGKPYYLIFALFEATSANRNKIRDEYQHKLINLDQIYQKRVESVFSRSYDPELFNIREFKLSDIYLFNLGRVPSDLYPKIAALLDYWEEQLDFTSRRQPQKTILMARTIAHGRYRINDYRGAFNMYRFFENIDYYPASLSYYNHFNRLSFSARALGFYQVAMELNQKHLIPLAEKLNDYQRLLQSKYDYYFTSFRLGNVTESLQGFEELYAIRDDFRDQRYVSGILNNLAVSYLNAGNFQQYIRLQLNALESAAEREDYVLQLNYLRNLHIFHRRQNENELSLSYLNEAFRIADENNITSEMPSILNSLGVFHRDVYQDYDQAVFYHTEARRITEETDNYRISQVSLQEKAETYRRAGNTEMALSLIRQSAEIAHLRDDQFMLSFNIIQEARLLTEKGDHASAVELINTLTPAQLNSLEFNIEVLRNVVLMKDAIERNDLDTVTHISRHITPGILDWLGESADMQTGHMRFDPEFTSAFDLSAKALILKDEQEDFLRLMEQIRGLTQSGFFNNPLLRSNLLTEDELMLDYTLSNQIQSLRNNLSNTTDERERIQINNEISELTSQRNELKNRLFSQVYEQRFSLRPIQRSLKDRSTVLYLNLFENSLYVTVLTRNSIKTHVDTLTVRDQNGLQKAVEKLTNRQTDLNLLYDIFDNHLNGRIPDATEHLIVVPDGIFYRIPMEILPVTKPSRSHSYGSAKYLVEKYSISYANSLSQIREFSRRSRQTDHEYAFLGFGLGTFQESVLARDRTLPDLPFAEREVRDIAAELTQARPRITFTGETVTEDRLRSLAGKSGILHIASHSEVSNENPLFSVIYMNKSDDEEQNRSDGYVYAYELFEMELLNELVVLSSCESGGGNYLQGSGVLGLSRAVQYAGAKSLMMNLWPVRDETARHITTRFYQHLNSGYAKDEALQKARLHYLNNVNSDPYLWGSFVIYGDVSPYIDTIPRKIQLFNLFAFLTLFAGFTFFWTMHCQKVEWERG